MPTFFTRPNPFKRSRRRRIRNAVATKQECRIRLLGVERAVIVMAAMEPDEDYIDNGREPFLLPGEWCREDV